MMRRGYGGVNATQAMRAHEARRAPRVWGAAQREARAAAQRCRVCRASRDYATGGAAPRLRDTSPIIFAEVCQPSACRVPLQRLVGGMRRGDNGKIKAVGACRR